jgi:hypothetical protein
MLPQPQQIRDLPRADSRHTPISFARIQSWRDGEYKAGRPSGLLDFYRGNGYCIACQASGSKPFPTDWQGEVPIFEPCNVCGGSGKVKVA